MATQANTEQRCSKHLILSLQKSAFELYRASSLGVEELAGCDEELMGHCLKCGRDNVKVLGGGS